MNQGLKCCGYYCSCLMIFGMLFFLILIIMQVNRNPFLTSKDPEETSDRISALAIAMGINLVCLFNCIMCLKVNDKKDKLKRE